MKTLIDRWLQVFISLLVCVLVISAVASYFNIKRLRDNYEHLEHSHEIVECLLRINSRAKDAETGQRGYLITDEQAYLTPYTIALDEIDSQIQYLESLVSDDPAQTQQAIELKKRVDYKLAELKNVIDIRHEEGFPQAQQSVRSHMGYNAMEQIRLVVVDMIQKEYSALNDMAQQADSSYSSAIYGGVITTFLGLLSTGLISYFLYRSDHAKTRARRSIEQEQQFLKTTLQSINDVVVVTDDLGRITMLNEAAFKMLGQPRENVIGQPGDDLIHIYNDSTNELMECPVKKTLQLGTPTGMSQNCIIKLPNGSHCPIDVSVAPIRSPQKLLGAIMIIRDMSERLKAERNALHFAKLAETEAIKLSAVIDAMPTGVVIANPDGKITHINQAIKEIWGYPPYSQSIEEYQDWRGWWMDTGERLKAEDWAMSRALVNHEVSRGEKIRIERFDGNGFRTILNNGSPIFDDRGTLISAVVTEQDITEITKTQDQLNDAKMRLQSTLQAGEIGTWIWDITHDQVLADSNLAEMFHISPDLANGAPIATYLSAIHPEDAPRLRQVIDQSMQTGDAIETEYRIVKPDGSYNWLYARGSVEYDDKQTPIRIPGVVIDITQRKHLEEDLRQLASDLSTADRRKNEFLATLAHELRNPLAPLRTGIEALIQNSHDSAQRQHIIEVMQKQIRQMVRLIDDLLDISRITNGRLNLQYSVCELREIIDTSIEATRSLFEQHHHQLHIDLPLQSVELQADAARLTQVFANLLSNAAKYTPDQGHIQLHATTTEDEVTITVTDNGLGISQDDQKNIFEMFGQVQRSLEEGYSGLGIGLALSKTLVSMHLGTISVSSPGLNQGSTFTVTLPLISSGQALFEDPSTIMELTAEQIASDQATPGQTYNVLVVDDNQAAAEMLALILRSLGHHVTAAFDGQQALDKASADHPDLIFMDIGMPKMNGYEATRQIRSQTWGESIPIIALTGWGKDDDKLRTASAGFNDHLVKPAEFKKIQQIINTLMPKSTHSPKPSNQPSLTAHQPTTAPAQSIATAPTPASDLQPPTDEFRKLAHDVKSPLSVISMGIELLKNQPLSEELVSLCEMIENDSTKPLIQQVENLIAYTRSKLDHHN